MAEDVSLDTGIIRTSSSAITCVRRADGLISESNFMVLRQESKCKELLFYKDLIALSRTYYRGQLNDWPARSSCPDCGCGGWNRLPSACSGHSTLKELPSTMHECLGGNCFLLKNTALSRANAAAKMLSSSTVPIK